MSDKFVMKEKEGSLFNNIENKKTDKHPDYTGSCVISGTKMNISAWINERQNTGKTYMRLKFDEYQTLEGATSTSSTSEFESADSNIPF